jgi:dUTP pyrophosphatase
MPRHPLSTTIRFQKLHEGVEIPTRATEGSAGFDLRAHLPAKVGISPGDRLLVPTGLRVEIEPGYEGQVRPRSGLACKEGVTVVNAPGTIDSDFRGEIHVGLINLGRTTYILEPGTRIAQLVIQALPRVTVVELEEGVELGHTGRGEGGFGSTGVS